MKKMTSFILIISSFSAFTTYSMSNEEPELKDKVQATVFQPQAHIHYLDQDHKEVKGSEEPEKKVQSQSEDTLPSDTDDEFIILDSNCPLSDTTEDEFVILDSNPQLNKPEPQESRLEFFTNVIYKPEYQEFREQIFEIEIEKFHKSDTFDELEKAVLLNLENYSATESEIKEVLRYSVEAFFFNDASAQYNIGALYHSGQRVIAQDYKKAFEWFKKAAKQNYASAQVCLGFMYYYGHGVAQDYKKALKWYTKIPAQNIVFAQYNIGRMHLYGQGVKKDENEAQQWFLKAFERIMKAEESNQSSTQNIFNQKILGSLYINGWGVDQDYKKAFEWFKKAAGLHCYPAEEKLFMLLGKVKADLLLAQEKRRLEEEKGNESKVSIPQDVSTASSPVPQMNELSLEDFENLNIPLRATEDGLIIRNTPRHTVGSPEKSYLINGKNFRLQNVSGTSMRCFFNAAGLEFEVELAKLKSRYNDPRVRYMIANEIISAAANPEQLPRRVKEAIQYTLYEAQRDQLNRLEEERGRKLAAQNPDGNLQDTQLLSTAFQSLDQEGDRIVEKLRRRAFSLEAFNAFLDDHIGSEQMMVALHDVQGDDGHGNANANYTSIDAVAYINNLGIKIYQSDGEGGLRPVHQFIPEGATEVVYLYHEGVHFQALMPENDGLYLIKETIRNS